MFRKDELEKMKNADITALDPSQLVDITEVVIDPATPETDRLDIFFKQIQNPYCYRVNDTPVKIRFGTEKPDIQRVLEDFFSQNK